MSSPVVSIIIPVYNAGAFIEKCLDSLCSQTVRDIEIIVVNDGSTDNSLSICEAYAAKDSRVKIIDKANAGVSEARNYGIKHSSGSYLMFVDADDWVAEDTIETCMPYIPEYDIVRFSARSVYPDRIKHYKIGKSSDIRKITASIIKRRTIVACWGGLFRRELFSDFDLKFKKGLRIGEDWLMSAELMNRCKSIKMLPEAYCYYYNKTNTDSCTMNLSKDKIMEQFKAWRAIKSVYPKEYRKEFRYTKCMFISELIKCCGMSEAGRTLHEHGENLRFRHIFPFLRSNVSIRKKANLLRMYYGKHIKPRS